MIVLLFLLLCSFCFLFVLFLYPPVKELDFFFLIVHLSIFLNSNFSRPPNRNQRQYAPLTIKLLISGTRAPRYLVSFFDFWTQTKTLLSNTLFFSSLLLASVCLQKLTYHIIGCLFLRTLSDAYGSGVRTSMSHSPSRAIGKPLFMQKIPRCKRPKVYMLMGRHKKKLVVWETRSRP